MLQPPKSVLAGFSNRINGAQYPSVRIDGKPSVTCQLPLPRTQPVGPADGASAEVAIISCTLRAAAVSQPTRELLCRSVTVSLQVGSWGDAGAVVRVYTTTR